MKSPLRGNSELKSGNPHVKNLLTSYRLAQASYLSISLCSKAFVLLHTGQNIVGPQMTRQAEPRRIQRRDILFFVGMVLKPLFKMTALTLFKPKSLAQQSNVFSDIYSKLWDFAEHSISHKAFSLPSSLGSAPVHNVNTLLCELYGGRFASLSFGGSSGALLAFLTAVLPKMHPKRDLILFDEVCHQSTIGGLIFGRWKAVRLTRDKHPKHKTAFPVTFETVRDIIEQHGPERFAAIILVLPTYDGFRAPDEDKKIYQYATAKGISVVVDGAWDAVSFRHDQADRPQLSSICDVWITSPHKRGLTPSSLGCIVTHKKMIAGLWDEALNLGFRSSSISFVEIMIAEHRLAQILAGDWDKAFEQAACAANLLRERIREVHPDLYAVKPEDVQAKFCDPAHILISTDKLSDLNARDWAKTLADHFSLDVEKATSSTLLLLCGSPAHLSRVDDIISILKEALNLTAAQNRRPLHDR